VHGLTLANATQANLARAAIEGMLCGLADGLDALVGEGVPVTRVLLVGGGARAEAVRRIAPTVLGCPVRVPPPGEYVADGAARQAAWTLTGTLPDWATGDAETVDTAPVPAIRDRYAQARERFVNRLG
jgi:xylulokinase